MCSIDFSSSTEKPLDCGHLSHILLYEMTSIGEEANIEYEFGN